MRSSCLRQLVPKGLFFAAALWGASGCWGEVLDVASLSLDELMEVEVTTPGKVPEAIRDTPASVYLVGREDIETFGYANLVEVLENVPGFYNLDNYNGADGNFGVRGFWNGRRQNSSVAILVNGVQQGRQDIFSHPLEFLSIPVEAIDRIEVSRGPNSVIYGHGAVFGAINIITDASFADDQLTVSNGSNDTRRVALRKSAFGEDSHLIVNAGVSKTDGYDHDIVDMISADRLPLLPNYGVDESTATMEDRLQQESAYLQVSAALGNLSLEYSLNDASVEWFTGFPAVADGSVRDNVTNRLTLAGEWEVGADWRAATSLTYSDFDIDQRFDALFPGFEGINTRNFSNWEIETLFFYEPDEAALRLLAGVNFQRMEGFEEYTHVPVLGLVDEQIEMDTRKTSSAFAQGSYNLSEKLRLVAGYRFEYLATFERRGYLDTPREGPPTFVAAEGGFDAHTPRLSLIYQPNDAHVFKFMQGDGNKLPELRNPILNAERTRTTELNYTWSSESLLFSGSVFRNTRTNVRVEELIVLPGNIVDFDYRSGGRAKSLGGELQLQGHFGSNVRGELGLTFVDSQDLSNPDGILSYSPEMVANAKLSYRKGDISFSALARYVGAMYSFYNSSEEETSSLVGDYFGERSSSYTTVDLNVRFENVFGRGFLSFNVSNVFDTEIRYPNNPINGLLLNRGNLGYGRRLGVKAGVRF